MAGAAKKQDQDVEIFESATQTQKDVIRILKNKTNRGLKKKLLELHVGELAEIIHTLPANKRSVVYKSIKQEIDPEVLTYLDPDLVEELVEFLGAKSSAKAITKLDTEDAVAVIEDLPQETQVEILDEAKGKSKASLQESLEYGEDSAGRLMKRNFIFAPEFWKVGDLIDYMRENSRSLDGDFYGVFIVDPKFRPIGFVLLSRVMQNQRDVDLKKLMDENLKALSPDLDQEEVAHMFRKYGLVEAPVVDDSGRMVGSVTIDDVVSIITEEGEEDILRLGGVAAQDFYSGVFDTVKQRFPWLFVNLLTAIAASVIIAVFDSTIQQIVALAVLMPIIASMGGNAGIQAVTVAVRALSMKELKSSNAASVLFKEMSIGFINGLAFAAIMAAVIWGYYGDSQLAMVFGISTVITLSVAGASGVAIPMIFTRLKIDPAIASGVILTMLTDVIGFFTFLGLAWILLTMV